MKIFDFFEHSKWDVLVQSSSHASLLQSFAWGEFQRALRKPVLRFVDETNTIVAQVIVEKLPMGISRWYIPRGPVGDIENASAFVDAIAEKARHDHASVLHIDPQELINVPTDAHHATRQPNATRILDLSLPESELLQHMKPKTRYNIKIAERHNVRIDYGTDSAYLRTFLALSQETAKRQNIRLHHEQYYKTLVETFRAANACEIIVASYQTTPLAALLILFYGDTMTYLHGASSDAYRNVMAPHAAHWFAMQRGKLHRMRYYDLWGEAPRGAASHSFASITRFKQGFGGEYIEYPDAIVKTISPVSAFFYHLYRKARG